MNDLTLDGLRRLGLRLLAAASLLLAACVAAIAVAAGGGKLAAIPFALLLVAPTAWVVWRDVRDEGARLIAATTPPALTGLLLFVSEGHGWQIDLHMIFFATLAMTVIMCDGKAILATTAVVAVHHLLLGILVPDWVFLGGGSILRVLLHAVVLVSEAGVLYWTGRCIVAMLDRIAHENAEREAAEKLAAGLRVAEGENQQRLMDALQAAADQRNAEAASQKLLLDALGTGLAALRDGDLSQAIETSFPPAYESLRVDYNAALSSLRELVSKIDESAQGVRATSGEIANAADDLARRTQRDSAQLQESAGALGAIDRRTRETAGEAARTLEEARAAFTSVEDGRQIAEGAFAAMDRVSDSARGIDGVIEGLDKIAFQTRVLAMNAAVEAGRAGEAGRGFAVVADLVSALAMRAEEEAKRARDQLSCTQSEIASAADSVRRMDSALASIADSVGAVHDLLGRIAAANASQSVELSAVSDAVVDMDRSAQQNAAMVEQTSAAVRSLVNEIGLISANARRFRTAAGPAPVLAAAFG